MFSVLFNVYQYVNAKHYFDNQETRHTALRSKIKKASDSINTLNELNYNLSYFTLLDNDRAMTYFENENLEALNIKTFVSEYIYDQNTLKGDHPLVPFEGMEGDMKINKIQFLNHKWIQADFTDGRYWGEMILQYDLNPDKTLNFRALGSFIYPVN